MVDRIKEKHVVGIKQAAKAISNDNCKTLYVAKDVEEKLVSPLIKKAMEKNVDIVYIDTMKELGRLCGIQVAASATAILIK